MLEQLTPPERSLTWRGMERLSRPLAWATIALLFIAVLTLGWYTAQEVVLRRLQPATLAASLAVPAEEPLRPGTPLTLSLAGYAAELQAVRLYRTDLGPAGETVGREQPVAVVLEATGERTWRVAASGAATPLRPDGRYRLDVLAVALEPALPAPRWVALQRQYAFSTVTSPRPVLLSDVLRPRWAEPVSLTWTAALASLEARAAPPVTVRAWVDEADARRTWVQVGGPGGEGLIGGQVYEITVAQAAARDGVALQAPAAFKVAVPARPRLEDVPTGEVALRRGEGLSLATSVPLADVRAETEGGLRAVVSLADGQVRIAVPEEQFRQGEWATVRVLSGTSEAGAPLDGVAEVRLRTPDAFEPPSFAPADGAVVESTATPAVTFAEPVADTAAAEQALSIEPAVEGEWRWTAADRVEFVPLARLPALTDFTVTVRGGPDGPRSLSGGYLEADAATSFRTKPFKKIDVNISQQLLSLIEGGRVVRTIRVGTGVPGADTPLGEFAVQYKMPQARFRGVNPSGLRYDIPDVKWVLAFWGDYTIHGAYWRTQFGVRSSNGCVGMPDAEAKVVYDWADVGTPISIHM